MCKFVIKNIFKKKTKVYRIFLNLDCIMKNIYKYMIIILKTRKT